MVDEIKVKVRPEIDDSKLDSEAKAAGQKAGAKFGSGLNAGISAIGIAGGAAIFAGVSAAIAAVGAAARQSVTDLRDFSRGVAEINSILPANEKLTRASENALIGFSSQFASGPTTQAQAFYNIVSAGVKGVTNQLQTLETANKAAVAGLVSIDDSAKLLVSSVNAYAKSGLTAKEASDALFVAVREGQTTFGELASSLGNVTGISASAGVEFSELTGAVAAFTKQGLKTDIAITGLRQALVSVVKPTKEAQDEAKRLGLQFDTAAIKSKGLAGFLKSVQTATNGNSLSLSKLFGNVRALTPILTTVNGNFGEFERILQQTSVSAGATAEAFQVISENLDFKLKQRSQEIQNFALIILRSFKDAFGGAVASAIPSIEAIQEAVIGLAGFVRDFIIAPFELAFNVIRTGFKGLVFIVDAAIAQVLSILNSTLVPLLKKLNIGAALVEGIETAAATTTQVANEAFEELASAADKTFEGTIYDRTDKFIENVKQNVAESNNIILEGQEQLASAMAETETTGGLAGTAEQQQSVFQNLSDGFTGFTDKALSDTERLNAAMKKLAANTVKAGERMRAGIANGIAQGFAAFGAALVKGENALGAFVKAFFSAIGQMAIQQGAFFLLEGLGLLFTPGGQAQGAALIKVGASMAALGGALTALSGGGASVGGGEFGAGGVGSIDSGSQFLTDQEEEREAPATTVGVTINGDVLDSEESGLRILNLLNDAFDKEGVVFRGAQTV